MRSRILALSLMFLTAGHVFANADNETRSVNIPSQPLASALRQFADQSGLQLAFETALATGITSRAVKGDFSNQKVLEKLLDGTGLRFDFLDNRTVAVSPAEKTSADKISSNDVLTAQNLQLAQSGQDSKTTSETTSTVSTENQTTPSDPTKELKDLMGEVVVTGTHIRNATNTAPLSTYTRDDIDRRGYLTTQDFIRSIPQNFKGGSTGASEDGFVGSANGVNNLESASGINLRGLGTSSTLVLLNGHRLAPSILGAAVDVSMIPLSAIDRIDVLSDGASAVYGSDAVGGVVNFVLRREYSGAETNLQTGSVTRGSRHQTIVGQTVGHNWSTGNALLSVQYDDESALRSDQRSFTATLPSPTDLYPSTRKYNGIFSAQQSLLGNVTASTDIIYGHQSGTRRYQTTDQFTKYSTGSDFVAANGGLVWNPSIPWSFETNALYSQVDTLARAVYDPIQPGYSNGAPLVRNNFILREADVVASGSLFSLPGGDAKTAIGASYREEELSSTAQWAGVYNQFGRDVRALFGEVSLPLVAEANAIPLVNRLAASVALRYDRYSDFGSTRNPKYGISWSPTSAIEFRASYGTSFHAPDASQQILNGASLYVFTYPFASPGGGETPVLVTLASPTLRAEKSRNTTFGFDLHLDQVPGLNFSLNFYDIVYRDRLVTPPFDPSALLTPEVYGPLITTFSTDAEAAAYVAGLVAQGFQFDDSITGTGTTGVRNAYSIALTNASRVRVNGFDASVAYAFSVGVDTFDVAFDATIIKGIKTGFCSSCTSTDLVDTYGQPLQRRMRANLGWSRGEWRWNAGVNYANSYKDTSTVPVGEVDTYTTVDLSVRYSPSRINGLTAGLNVINLLDADPPHIGSGFTFSGLHYDSANSDPLGRFVSVQIRKSW